MLTIDHTRAFQAEATGKHPRYDALEGTTNGIDWHLGPPTDRAGKAQTTCPDCFREITSGMTVYRPEAPSFGNAHYRNNTPTTAIYVCAACFNWAQWVRAQHTTAPERRHPVGLNAIKALDKITRERAPRFRVEARDDLLAMSDAELGLYAETAPRWHFDPRLAVAAVRAQRRLRHLQAVA